ncbi:competence protein ComEA [Geobacillus subterraneus]|uniref:Competence protein ComEA n=2 Tax=Geobacillus TaxID=129337 RepID=A0ABM6A991_9BACL|nr:MULTISPECIES: helix-hairpin-helix domain-containing protein [Geobacillus]AMX82833.1 competence protein ComEA [Geobacillus subterraneus]KZS26089.1 competence protein ComEA [Geobacillus subterraneus]OXB90924.1 competence protein ComEA [Geobacillus uzenensis]QIZ68433.1 ComEA family DNA-binding protein [Geobacillus subterraneus]
MWETVKTRWKTGLIVLFVAAAGLWVFGRPPAERAPVALPTAVGTDAAETEEHEGKEPKVVVIDVKGAVAKPGVYEMPADARVRDVIARAGGLTNEADAARVNLAAKVHDEMMIYVPAKGEAALAPETAGAAPEAGTESGLQVAVNTATEEELMQIPGIGPTKAKAIIAYRDEHGPFQRVEDLLKVSGIGEKTLEKLKPYLLVP